MKLYKNIKLWTLAAMGMASFVMLIAEADAMGALVASKAVGILLACATYKLGKHWQIDRELDKYLKEE